MAFAVLFGSSPVCAGETGTTSFLAPSQAQQIVPKDALSGVPYNLHRYVHRMMDLRSSKKLARANRALNNNRVHEYLDGSVPTALGNLVARLQRLGLPQEHNQLKELSLENFGETFSQNEELRHALLLEETLLKQRQLQKFSLRNTKMDDEAVPSLARALEGLSELEELDLSGNDHIWIDGIKALAEVLPKMQNLKILNLSGTWPAPDDDPPYDGDGVEDDAAEALANAFAKMPALKILRLADTPCFADGGMIALATALPKMKALKVLDLSRKDGMSFSPFSPEAATALANALPQMEALTELDIGGNANGGVMEPEIDMDDILFHKKFDMLGSVSGYLITEERALEELADALSQMPALAKLGLSKFFAGGEDEPDSNPRPGGINFFVEALPKIKTLTELNLQGNCFGDKETEDLARMLSKMPGLEKLDLSKTTRSKSPRHRSKSFRLASLDEKAKALAKAFPQIQSPALEMLRLADTPCFADGMTALAGALPKMKALKVLDLSQGEEGSAFSAVAAKALANALRQMGALVELDIGGQGGVMPDDRDGETQDDAETALQLLADALSQMPALAKLGLSEFFAGGEDGPNSNPRPKQILHFVEALPNIKTLTELNLQGNCFGDAEAEEYLAKMLSKMPGLKKLDLSENAIKNYGALALGKARPAGENQTLVNLRGNDIDEAGMEMLAELPTQIQLELDEDSGTPRGLRALRKDGVFDSVGDETPDGGNGGQQPVTANGVTNHYYDPPGGAAQAWYGSNGGYPYQPQPITVFMMPAFFPTI